MLRVDPVSDEEWEELKEKNKKSLPNLVTTTRRSTYKTVKSDIFIGPQSACQTPNRTREKRDKNDNVAVDCCCCRVQSSAHLFLLGPIKNVVFSINDHDEDDDDFSLKKILRGPR